MKKRGFVLGLQDEIRKYENFKILIRLRGGGGILMEPKPNFFQKTLSTLFSYRTQFFNL